MIISSTWMSWLWTGTSLLLAVMMLLIAVRYLRHRQRGHLLIVFGGMLAGIFGIASQILRMVVLHRLYSSFDPDRVRSIGSFVGIGAVFGQLLFLIGIFLAAARTSNERRRMAELEAIIRDRDGDSPP